MATPITADVGNVHPAHDAAIIHAMEQTETEAKRSGRIEQIRVIEEACGNGYLALLIAGFATYVRCLAGGGTPALGIGASMLGLAAVSLYVIHRRVKGQQ